MTSPKFLNTEEFLDLIFAELPDGLYSTDRADNSDYEKRSYSSSELRAHAKIFSDICLSLQNIYRDKFISTVTPDGLAKWEKELFASVQDSSLTYNQRQQNLLSKWRAIGGISLPAISNVIHGILDAVGLEFDIFPYIGQFNGVTFGSWVLDYSQLGLDTFLAFIDPLLGSGRGIGITPLSCSRDYVAAGITEDQMHEIEKTAYTYEVWIYGVADAQTLAILDKQLTSLEPARSTHIVRNNMVRPPI